MNIVILMGRLTSDPEIRSTPGGKTVATYTLAVDRRKEGADFIRCQCWERSADFAEKYLHKGTKIAVTGHIQTGSYKDKNGKTIYTTDVIVETHDFCESKKDAKAESRDDGFMTIHEGEEPPFV